MDYSTEQYHYQQQQQQYYNQYQQQQQQQQPEAAAVTYDQSSTTTAQPYYDYNNNQQQYPYYYSSSSSYPQQQQQYYQEPTSTIHPPGVPIQPDPTPSSVQNQTHFQTHQFPYYTPGVVDSQSQQHLNPVDAIPQIGEFAYKGGGRKGGRPFRGGGRGRFGYRGPRPDGPASSVRGRGRSQGGARHFPPHGATPNSALMPAEGGASLMPTSASVPGQAPLPVPAQMPAAAFWPPPRMAWCELCRVDCNTLEILEQHKKGKRHKKNLQIHEELQNLNKIITGQQNVQEPNSELKPGVQSEKVEGSEEKQPPQVSLPSEAVSDDKKIEREQQKDTVDKSGVSSVDSAEVTERKSRDHFEARGHAFKRKMRGGRGGKYMRTNEGPRRPVEPPKPKEVIPFICELCNVKCESQVVFDSHLAGKKHQSNLKRFHSHRALYGEAGLQALYPPNSNAPSSSFIPQVQQVVNDPQVVLAQLLTYVLSQAQAPGLVAAQVPGHAATEAAALAPGLSAETQYLHVSQAQGSQVITEADINNALTVESVSQWQSMTAKFEAPTAANIDTKAENGTFVSDAKDVSLPQDNSVKAPSENPDVEAEQVLTANATEEAVPIPECEVTCTGQVFQPGLDNEEDPEEDPEE